MREAADVPLDEQTLGIQGLASEAAVAQVRSGLPDTWGADCLLLLVSFSYADLPVGTVFDCAFAPGEPERWTRMAATVIAVTQQFARPFDELPHGWKTFTLFRFQHAPPEPVCALPELDTWDYTTRLIFSSDQARAANLG